MRVLRGGSWNNEPWTLRLANRRRGPADVRDSDFGSDTYSDDGFRIARSLP